MAFPVVQEAIESSTNTAGTSHVITLPTATANQLLLIISDLGSTAATINAHASLTELLDEGVANGLYIAYRWMDGSEPASYTLTSSASTRDATIAYRISGAINPAAQAPQIGTTATGTSATPDPPASAAPSSTKDYLFIAFAGMAGEEADDDTWGNTPPTNYTPSPPRQKSCGTAGTNLGGLILSAERQLNTGAAENPGTFGVDVSAAWRSQTIMVHPIVDTAVTPGVASLTTILFAPTVTVTNNVLVTPDVASLALTGFAPTVSTPVSVTPGVAVLTLATFAPDVSVSSGLVLTPGVASLTLTAFAPTVSTPVSVSPGLATLTLSTFAPTVTATDHQLVTPGTASLTLTTFAPSVAAGVSVTPGVAALSLTGFAPTVVLTDNQLVTPATASLVLSTFAATVLTPVTVTPGTAALSLMGYAPTVTTFSIVSGGLPPIGSAIQAIPDSGAIALSPGARTIHPLPE